MITQKKKKKAVHSQKTLIAIAAFIAILLVAQICILLFIPTDKKVDPSPSPVTALLSPKEKIKDGVTISGLSVGGKTEQKALDFVTSSLPNSFAENDFVVTYGTNQMTLTPEDVEVYWDIKTAVEKALKAQYGDIPVELHINKQTIRKRLTDFFSSLGGVYSPSGFWLEGVTPNLNSSDADSCQTLVLNVGSSGLDIDIESVLDQIVSAYQSDTFSLDIPDGQERKEAKPLNLEDILQQVSIAPINPDIDRDTLVIIPGKPGYSFDFEKAEKMLANSKSGESIRISMEFTEPEMAEDDVWFLDTLGYCKTEHTDNENRNENLRLACSKLNGLILQPGDILSYNETLGKRTSEAGYKPAPAYSGVELVDEIGGGICQVSSTLYLSSLFAELSIVERRNHGFPANYIPLGLDATVNWGTTDLKIRNDYDLPVKILAEVSDGCVKVRIMGVDQRDHYVKMEYRVDDHPSYAAAYKCLYNRETDEEISRVLNHTSIYLEDVWCWPGYIESAKDD